MHLEEPAAFNSCQNFLFNPKYVGNQAEAAPLLGDYQKAAVAGQRLRRKVVMKG